MGHGDDGRTGQKAFVVVPHVGPVAQLGVDDRDLFEAFTQVREESVHFRFAKVFCNRQVLLGCQVRNMQHKGFVLDQRVFDGLQCVWFGYIGSMEIDHLGANMRTKGTNSDR